MAEILIAGVIGGYSLWVVWKKYRDIRDKRFCGGCCMDCRVCKKDKL